ncbi:hypothetical protein [uncultured Bacteroides sp.]|uniref:hypothetical protein n=1 Tax=uncultured Bacteroides sp. TaxID=162156 RepID=UPI0025D5191D|nr:hypothetical protein [uncultured Bacteroides sp.]
MNKILLFLLVCSYTIFVSGKTEMTSLLKQEKIYIHTDKPFYLMGDTIWIKGYLVDAQTHKEQDVQSRFIHVELINDKNKVLLRKKLMAEEGVYRNFFSLENDIPEGRYMLRAYTNYMRNEDESFFYTKQITVYGNMSSLLVLNVRHEVDKGKRYAIVTLSQKNGEPYAGKQVEYMIRTQEYENKILQKRTDKAGEIRILIPQKQDLPQYIEISLKDDGLNITRKIDLPDVYDYHVGFYPEGGHLLSGVEQIIAFKAESTTGISPLIKGHVINQVGDTLASFQSEHEGIGSFTLVAQAGDSLSAVTMDESDVEKRFTLPSAVADKIALSVVQDDSLIHYRLCLPKNQILKEELELLAHVRGQIVFRNKIASEQLSGSFSKRDVPEGIVHFTVFNANEEALTERLAFVHRDEPMFQVAVFGSSTEPRSLLKLGIKLLDADYNPLQGNFSMSVTDNFAVPQEQDNEDIRSTLLLTSDLKGCIPTPGYYLEHSTPECVKHLDQLMLTQGWTRFQSSALLHPIKEDSADWKPEQVQIISGSLKGFFNKKTRKPIKISVAVPKYGRVNTVISDKNGEFNITHDCPDMTGFIITPSRKKADLYTVELKEDTYPAVTQLKWKSEGKAKASSEYMYEVQEGYKIVDGEKVYQMAEVVIQGISPLAGYSYKSVNKTFIEQQKAGNALELLNQMPEVCIYRVMKKMDRDGVPVPTGERHVGLLKRDFFIEDYLRTDADLVPRKTGGSSNPKNPTKEQKVGDLSTNPVLKPAQQAGLTQDGRQCARVSVFVDGVKVENENNLEKLQASDVQFIDMLNNPELRAEENTLSNFARNRKHAWSIDDDSEYKDLYSQSIQITTSRLNRGRFVESLPHVLHVVPLGYAEQAEFYSPRYPTSESRKVIDSDMRSTIYWTPDLRLNEQGETALSFYTADRSSNYTVLIEGVTTEGIVCRYVKQIKGKRVH